MLRFQNGPYLDAGCPLKEGRKRFLYDLWGDAVNTASRMESHGTSGRIQITRATKELLEDEFVCEPRGTIPIKGKGEIEAWYLVSRRGGIPAPAVVRFYEKEDQDGKDRRDRIRLPRWRR